MPIQIAVVYHSGYGHTAKVAETIASEAAAAGAEVDLIKADTITDAEWDKLDKAHAIVFGAPTYMGSVSGPFKVFMDATSKKWTDRKWKDKIAAGFTNSGSYSGDKFNSLIQLYTLAMQHAMIWVGLGELPPTFDAGDMPDPDKINRLGAFGGLMTQSNHKQGADLAPGKGDLETAKLFARRIVDVTKRFVR